ncbi:MAG: tetratricopeptide repeat protein [Phycisphaerae bacterium]
MVADNQQTQTATAGPESSNRASQPAAARCATGRGWDILWLSAIVLVAFVLRTIYILQLQASPYFSVHVMDPQYHHEWARAFAAGEVFWNGPYFRAPLYPWFLGAIYWLFGPDNALAPRIVQAALGSLSCGLLYLIGRRVFSRTVGVIAGFAAATYWVFLYYDVELLIPVLIVFLDLVLLRLLLWARDRRSLLLWGTCGFVLGLSTIARPNILLLVLALVVWILVLHRPDWRRAVGSATCLFVGCMLPILPITIRNYVVGDDLVLIASQGGVNFYIGNNPHSDGMSAIIKGDPGQWQACYDAQIARAQQALGHPPMASEVSRWYSRQALRFMCEQPGRAAAHMLKKLAYFWSHWEVSNNRDIYFFTGHYTPIVRYLPLGFRIVGPLGALGLCLSLRRAKQLFPLWGFVLTYTVSVVLFFVTARYRVPVVAVLILLGSYAACWLGAALRARRWRSVGFAALVLAVMGLVAARTPPNVDKAMIQGHLETGLELARQGRPAQAEHILTEYVKRARALGRTVEAPSWYSLGYVRLRLEKYAEAVECFERALELRPFYPEARSKLGYAFVALGRPYKAMEQFERIVRDDPQNDKAHVDLANGMAQLGRIDTAIQHILRAIEINAANAQKLVEIAERLRGRGDASGAERLLQAGRERFPELMPRVAPPD